MPSPLDNNPFVDPLLAHFRQDAPAALDPYRAFFMAQITGRTRVAGVWNYDWVEQTFDSATGLPADANPQRSGGIVAGSPISPAIEANNIEVGIGTFVFMKSKGIVGGQVYYEFADPTNGTGGSSGTNCTGCGWLAALSSASCLALLVDGVVQTVTGDDTTLVTLATDVSAHTWTGANTITIGGADYTVSFTRTPGGLPGMVLTSSGSGGISYTGYPGCCVCGRVTFGFSRADLDPDSEVSCNACDNIIRVTVALAPCDFVEGWYCVRKCGTTGRGVPTHLLAADAVDPDIEILPGGPYDTEEDADVACGPITSVCCTPGTDLPLQLCVTWSVPPAAGCTGSVIFTYDPSSHAWLPPAGSLCRYFDPGGGTYVPFSISCGGAPAHWHLRTGGGTPDEFAGTDCPDGVLNLSFPASSCTVKAYAPGECP